MTEEQITLKEQNIKIQFFRDLIQNDRFMKPAPQTRDIDKLYQMEAFDIVNLNRSDSALILHVEDLNEHEQRVFSFRFIGTSATPSFSELTFDKTVGVLSDRVIMKRSDTLRLFKTISMTEDVREVFEDALRLVTDYLLSCYSYLKRDSERSDNEVELIWQDKRSKYKPAEEMCQELCLPLSVLKTESSIEMIQEIIFLTLLNLFFRSEA